VEVRLAERPGVQGEDTAHPASVVPGHAVTDAAARRTPDALLGLEVRDLDAAVARRVSVPSSMRGLLVSSVEPLGAAEEAGMERGDILLEVNRQPVRSVAEYHRLIGAVQEGEVLAFYCYVPSLGQRVLRTVRLESWPE
jgi:S1-C subfamily serine protease